MNPTVILLLAIALICLFTPDAAAEVSDKIPPRALVLAWAFACLFVTAVAWSYRRWVGLLATLLVALPTLAILSELFDPFVGPAIRNEQGVLYVAAPITAVTGIILGSIYGIRSQRRRIRPDFDRRKGHPGRAK